MTDSLIRYLVNLKPAPPHFGGMGATRLSLDPRDASVLTYPGVCSAFAAGPPDSATLLPQIKEPPYNQGSRGACVAASTSSACTIDTGRGAPEEFDWLKLYEEAGGTGANGVDSRLVLSNCVKLGTPRLDGTREPIIASYAFVTQQPGAFRNEIKACIAAGQPVVVALLLPSDFGWQSGHGAPTSGYHQVCGFAYDPTYLWIWNSWGNWPGGASPGPGIGSLTWDYLEADGMQHGYCFSYSTSSAALPSPVPVPPVPVPPPVPPPPGGVTVAGRISGTGTGLLAVGQSYPIQAQGLDAALTLTQIQGGPAPVPPPPPPGDLIVAVASGAHHLLSATVRDQTGAYVAATCIATTAAGQVLGGRQTTPAGSTAIPAVWITTGLPPGTAVTVSATTSDGRTGTGQGTTS